jgi:hypothetical protein
VFPVRYELNLYMLCRRKYRPPLWSSGQNSCLQNGDILFLLRYGMKTYTYICIYIHTLPHFLRSSGSGKGSTQPLEYS